MQTEPDEIFCRSCSSYAHPFLAACPVCGLERVSRYEAATEEPEQGLVALASSPRLTREVTEVLRRYALNRMGSAADVTMPEGLGTVADALSYRVRISGAAGGGIDRGHVEVGEADLVVRERNPSRERARIALDTILAVSPSAPGRRADAWAGLVFEGRREPSPPPSLDGNLVIAHAGPTGLGRIALANRTGLLAPRARADHYAILARWMGIVAAGAAERRWTTMGAQRHAHELGLTTAPSGGWPATAVADPPSAGPASVAEALRLLEELRAAGLVSGDEYAAKRSEILDRI